MFNSGRLQTAGLRLRNPGVVLGNFSDDVPAGFETAGYVRVDPVDQLTVGCDLNVSHADKRQLVGRTVKIPRGRFHRNVIERNTQR